VLGINFYKLHVWNWIGIWTSAFWGAVPELASG
jgi:hypothetical protein